MSQISQRPFDLLVFDWDGTLFDSTALIAQCIQDACRDLGCLIPDLSAAKRVIGLGLVDALKQVVPDLPQERYPELAARYRFHYFATQHQVTLFDGVPEFLQHCRDQGYMLAVATGKSRRGLDEALSSVGLRAMFDDTRTADETAGKPDPQMLNELMQVLDTPAARTLMVGDTTHDIQMAVNAHVPSLAVSYGAHTPTVLSSYTEAQGMLGIVHSIDEMAHWLEQRNSNEAAI